MSHSVLIGRLGRSLARKRKMLWQLMFFVLGQCWDQRLAWGQGEREVLDQGMDERVIDGWMVGNWRMGKWTRW